MGRWARRVDDNQKQIVDELRQAGFSVAPRHDDLLVGRNNITLWVEVKRPLGPRGGDPSRLTLSQSKLKDEWRGAFLIARSADDVIDWFNNALR